MTSEEETRFERWLVAHGAEVLETTNPYEIVRFRAMGNLGIVYRDKHGDVSTLVGEAAGALAAFRAARDWRGTKKKKRKRGAGLRAFLLERDGERCFYCGRTLWLRPEPPPRDDLATSIEHFVPATHGGPSHPANLALVHRGCNQQAGTLSVAEKARLRERLHEETRRWYQGLFEEEGR